MVTPTDIAGSVLPSVSTIIANISGLVIFAALVVAGIVKGLKEVREFRKPDAATPGQPAQIAAATILENVTLGEWSRTNMLVVNAIRDLIEVMGKHRDEVHEQRLETADLRHAIAGLERSLSRGKHDDQPA